jgi:CelD/BcsL family acetyltransferase involved in cellulose biosynthesis
LTSETTETSGSFPRDLMAVAIDDPRWLELVSTSGNALPFHHPAWARALARCYGFRPFTLGVPDSNDRLRAGIPLIEVAGRLTRRRWIALPFTDRCPPVTTGQDGLETFVNALDNARRTGRVASVEVRSKLPGGRTTLVPHGVMHTLELEPDSAAVLQKSSKSQVQRNIRRAEREGVTIRRAESVEELADTYYALHVDTRRRQGAPAQPRRWFELLWSELIERDLGFVLLAYAGRVAVAGGVFLTWNGTVTYKYGASRRESWPLRPNHLLFWDAIRWSCESGFHTFDWGRSDLDNHGLRAFKSSWGAVETPLLYSSIGAFRDPRWLGLAQRWAAPIIRRSPPWVCRAIGSAFYSLAA